MKSLKRFYVSGKTIFTNPFLLVVTFFFLKLLLGLLQEKSFNSIPLV